MSAQPAPPAPEPEPSPARVRLRRLRVAALIGLVATTMVTTLVGGFFTQLGTGAYNRVFTPQTPTTTHPPPGPTPTPAASTTATAGPATSPPVPPPPTRGPSSAPRPSPTRTAGPSPTGAAVRTPTTNLRLYPGRNGDTGQGLDLDSAPGAWIGPVGCPDTDFYVNDNATRMTNLYGCWTQTPPAGASFALVATDAPISYDTCAHHDWSVHGMAFATLRVGLRFCVWTGEHRRALVTVTGLNTEPETPDSPHTVNYLDLTITVWEQATEVA